VVLGGGRWVLDGSLHRRTLLKGASGAALTALAVACGPSTLGGASATAGPSPASASASPAAASASPGPSPSAASAAVASGPETVYVFNVGSRDVTLIDAATRQARETRPLGAAVRFLSNEQTYWDGQLVWTYDFPDNKLQAIGIDPRSVAVTRTIGDLGTGPGHSLMLLPDSRTAAINVAGDNVIAVIDVASSQIIRKVPTGKFPCDLHFTPDGRYAFTPERDQDTVSMFDTRSWDLVKTVTFPQGSQPYMLRVSPDGKEVWVQTAQVNTNVVLNAADLSTLATLQTGQGPLNNAWTPDARYSVVTNTGDSFASVFDAMTYKEVARLAVGQGASNIGFTRDGSTGFMSVTSANTVAVIDMAGLTVVSQLPAGQQPTGLIIR